MGIIGLKGLFLGISTPMGKAGIARGV